MCPDERYMEIETTRASIGRFLEEKFGDELSPHGFSPHGNPTPPAWLESYSRSEITSSVARELLASLDAERESFLWELGPTDTESGEFGISLPPLVVGLRVPSYKDGAGGTRPVISPTKEGVMTWVLYEFFSRMHRGRLLGPQDERTYYLHQDEEEREYALFWARMLQFVKTYPLPFLTVEAREAGVTEQGLILFRSYLDQSLVQ